jgi:hypothetical protein
MGAAVGNIIATIMTTQIARNGAVREDIAMCMSWGCHTSASHAAAARTNSKTNMMLRNGIWTDFVHRCIPQREQRAAMTARIISRPHKYNTPSLEVLGGPHISNPLHFGVHN